jgi:tRNA (adenine22-N1)-methyltransferase
LADVGTDHAYLPVWLLLHSRVKSAIAADLRPGPLDSARRTAAQYGVTERLSFRLCDGLTDIRPEEADAVTIAGMGGETISAILEAAPWTKEETALVLQPMTSLPDLRNWLQSHGYRIWRERVVWDEGKLYTVMAVSAGGMPPLSLGEQYAGRPESWAVEPIRLDYLEHLMEKLRRELAGVERSSKAEDQPRRGLLRQTIEELEEMKGAWQHDHGI